MCSKGLYFPVIALIVLLFFCMQQDAIAQGGVNKRELLKESATAAAVSLFTFIKEDADKEDADKEDADKEDADKGDADDLKPFPLGTGVVIDFKKKIKRNYILTSCKSIWYTPKVGVASLSDGRNFNAAAFLDLRRSGPTLDGPGLVCFDRENNYAVIDLPRQLADVPKLKLQSKLLKKNDTVTVISFPGGKFQSYRAKVLGYEKYAVVPVGKKDSVWVTKLAIVPHKKGSLGGFVIDKNNHIYGIITNHIQKNGNKYQSSGGTGSAIGLATPSLIVGRALVASNFLK